MYTIDAMGSSMSVYPELLGRSVIITSVTATLAQLARAPLS